MKNNPVYSGKTGRDVFIEKARGKNVANRAKDELLEALSIRDANKKEKVIIKNMKKYIAGLKPSQRPKLDRVT